MNAQEIIEYIRTSKKKTPVKVYVWEKTPVEFPGCEVFNAAPGQKIVFGDWMTLLPCWRRTSLPMWRSRTTAAIPLSPCWI